jgi:hypothetical protein
MLAPRLFASRYLRIRSAAGEVLRVTDRIDGAAYVLTFAGPAGPRSLSLDLAGLRADTPPAPLQALAAEALDAVGLGR